MNFIFSIIGGTAFLLAIFSVFEDSIESKRLGAILLSVSTICFSIVLYLSSVIDPVIIVRYNDITVQNQVPSESDPDIINVKNINKCVVYFTYDRKYLADSGDNEQIIFRNTNCENLSDWQKERIKIRESKLAKL